MADDFWDMWQGILEIQNIQRDKFLKRVQHKILKKCLKLTLGFCQGLFVSVYEETH